MTVSQISCHEHGHPNTAEGSPLPPSNVIARSLPLPRQCAPALGKAANTRRYEPPEDPTSDYYRIAFEGMVRDE
jgi:hypothetical protein